MARPIPDVDLRRLVELQREDFIKPSDPKDKAFIDFLIDSVKTKTGKNIILGTVSGWITGVTVIRVGRVAAFGIGGCIILLHFASEWGYIHVNWDRVRQSVGEGQACVEKMVGVLKKNSCFSVGFLGGFFFGVGSTLPLKPVLPLAPPDPERPIPPEPIPPKPPEPPFIPEEPNVFEKPFIPPKPIPHSPKISPSSIPNPSPSITASKQEPGYPNYGGYLYSIPGYSAFQPVAYSGMVPTQPPVQTDGPNSEFIPFPPQPVNEVTTEETKVEEPPKEIQKPQAQTDFEEQFTPEVVPATSEAKTQTVESKMSITSLTQGSGATVTIPSQNAPKDVRKKPERYSLKTSIPISKIDMKCVNTPPDSIYQNAISKKHFNPAFSKDSPKVEIQSNIVIKPATKETEVTEIKPSVNTTNAPNSKAETVIKLDHQFRVPEPKADPPADKDTASVPRPIFNPINIDTSKVNFSKEQPNNEQKNKIVLIQNKINTKSKMLLTIQQPSSQGPVQRTNGDSKNLQAPSRPSNQSKKSQDEIEGSSSKVVALKRLHQENCDENDFENLITENQIYGNKIVVKEKSQITHQEQDIKNKKPPEKTPTTEAKNVVLQPNFLYLSNVQFPNLMMIKNKTKITQTEIDASKPNENKVTSDANVAKNTEIVAKPLKQNPTINKEIHVLKSSNNLLQSLPKTRPELVIQTNQKVIVNPQFVYQVPIMSSIVDGDKVITRDYPKFITPKKDYPKPFESQPNDKLYIACPYQMDSKLQPKIVITNIRPKKIEEISSLDVYEKKKRLRRLKYLSNRENKDSKVETPNNKIDLTSKNKIPYTEKNDLGIITPDKMKNEIYKEFANTKVVVEESDSGSDSDDFGEEDLRTFDSIIEEYEIKVNNVKEKEDFLATFRLASIEAYKEKDLEVQDRMLRHDSVASAYAAVGRLDALHHTPEDTEPCSSPEIADVITCDMAEENRASIQRKKMFMSQMCLSQVTSEYKEGYEKVWKEVLIERKRRDNLIIDGAIKPTPPRSSRLEFDSNNQLRLLTEIKKSVSDNNNLIKKRLDFNEPICNEDSIRELAEKNFSELTRLSKMADRSVKLFSGQNTRKRDLNPGFDSENIQKRTKIEQPFENYPKLNIPNISKIISLKSTVECQTSSTTQATSMDEPQNSAAGVKEMFAGTSSIQCTRDVASQVEIMWPGIKGIAKIFKEFEAARKREVSELHRRNTALRVDGAHITRAASRDSDRARALLAERQHLAKEENSLRMSLERLKNAIEVIRNY